MIIFDEEEHVKKILKDEISISNKNKYDLQLLTIYYKNQGLDNDEIYNKIDTFCKANIINYNSDTSYKILDKLIKNSNNRKLKSAAPIFITCAELDTIKKETSLKIQKIMFVYLVLAKYYMSNNHTDKFYVGMKDSDIFSLCKFYAKKNEKLNYMYYLTQKGYITPTLTMSSIVNYIDEDSPIILTLIPNDDMEFEFEKYNGIKFIKCERCGKLERKKNNKHKYCLSCAKKIKSAKSH